jgi:V-type H+-transporting ATPase subunit C
VLFQAGFLDCDQNFQQGNYVEFYEHVKAAAREKRFLVRDVVVADCCSGSSKNEIADLEILVAEKQAGLERWCRTHYGEAFNAWIHIKVVRAFVESVLRYGVSVGPSRLVAGCSNASHVAVLISESIPTGPCQAKG